MTTSTTRRDVLALVAAIFMGAVLPAQAAPNACGLLTDAEAATLIARGQPTYSEPNAMAVGGGKGNICQYEHGQTGLWMGPGAEAIFEQHLVTWKQDKVPRQPVSGVGDKAYVIYPKARSKFSDEGPMVVATVGAHIVTAGLFARKSQADGLMGEICRGDQSRLNEKEKKNCAAVLADKGETSESLQPAVVELAKVLAAKVRAGRLGQ
jgi:hypothetical protein